MTIAVTSAAVASARTGRQALKPPGEPSRPTTNSRDKPGCPPLSSKHCQGFTRWDCLTRTSRCSWKSSRRRGFEGSAPFELAVNRLQPRRKTRRRDSRQRTFASAFKRYLGILRWSIGCPETESGVSALQREAGGQESSERHPGPRFGAGAAHTSRRAGAGWKRISEREEVGSFSSMGPGTTKEAARTSTGSIQNTPAFRPASRASRGPMIGSDPPNLNRRNFDPPGVPATMSPVPSADAKTGAATGRTTSLFPSLPCE